MNAITFDEDTKHNMAFAFDYEGTNALQNGIENIESI